VQKSAFKQGNSPGGAGFFKERRNSESLMNRAFRVHFGINLMVSGMSCLFEKASGNQTKSKKSNVLSRQLWRNRITPAEIGGV
jgi:hypothetical protein